MKIAIRKLLMVAGLLIVVTPRFCAADELQTKLADKNEIQALEVAEQGGVTYVAVTLNNPLASVPVGFSVAEPARVVFDFSNTANATGETSKKFDFGDLRGANLVQVGDRTRLVLNLLKMNSYEARIDGRRLLISLSPIGSIADSYKSAEVVAETFSAARGGDAGVLSIRDVNFRRGSDGAGRVAVDLSSSDAGINIKKEGESLIVEFLNSRVPEHLRKRSDVNDFATPVSGFSVEQSGVHARLVVVPNGLWEHNAFQSDTQFVLEVRRISEEQKRLRLGDKGRFSGEKLSLNFQDVEIRSVLQVIADFTDVNIVTSDTVQGRLTLRLKDVPWDQALSLVLQAKNLSFKRDGDVIWIATVSEIEAQQKAEALRQQLDRDLEPVHTEIFQINYHDAEQIAELIRAQIKGVTRNASTQGGGASRNVPLSASGSGWDQYTSTAYLDTGRVGLLSERGSVTADKKTNKLLVRDIAASREAIAAFIKQIDIPPRQVLIEARIVEANKTFARDLGVRLEFGDRKARSLGDGGKIGFGSSELGGGGNTFVPGLATSGLQTSAFGQMNLTLFNNSLTRFLNLELRAQETDGTIRLVSSPRILTADQAEAVIEEGTEIPYEEASSSGATSVSFKKAVLSLKVTPQITPDGRLQLDLEVNKDSRGLDTRAGPAIDTKKVKSKVSIENGGTVVIGGVYTEDDTNTTEQVPLLGDIPVLGNLFKTNSRSSDRRELLVFITPRIVSDALTLR